MLPSKVLLNDIPPSNMLMNYMLPSNVPLSSIPEDVFASSFVYVAPPWAADTNLAFLTKLTVSSSIIYNILLNMPPSNVPLNNVQLNNMPPSTVLLNNKPPSKMLLSKLLLNNMLVNNISQASSLAFVMQMSSIRNYL